ncbi:prepilin peptidase [Pseudonocardia sp. TRM90224]|uniref:prepilin peptidase n=1 Tax=Pseudonocardia sp. TRM90224 TaxID=2812678 RepID=UPI001E4642B5|nr:A24 family peptidase [Pseudonocardia sp. TRM90224]
MDADVGTGWGAVAGFGTALTFGVAGLVAGGMARWLLARLRRGAVVRAPACELAVGGLWAVCGAAWVGGWLATPWLAVVLALAWLGVALAIVDIRHRRLPDLLTLPALPVALVLLAPLGAEAVLRGLAGAGVALVLHAAVHLAAPRAIGAGDVKLAAPLGAVLAASSWAALPLAAALSMVITAVVGVVGLLVRRLRRGSAVPHGPSMLLASWLVVVAAAGTGGVAAGAG